VPGSPTEADVLAALDGDGAFRGGPLVVRIGPGYQRSAGDWETNDAFPHGHRWLTDRIHAAGFRAGLWLAPLLVAERSGIPTAHPDWLLRTPDGDPVVVEETGDRGGRVYALDAAQVSARDYLRDLARHTVAGWGYDELTLDQLRFGAVSAGARGPTSRSEAYRAALRALREGAANAFVTACAAPLQHAVGLVDAVRLGPDGDGFETLRRDACSVALRGAFQGGPWLNDPGRVKIAGSLSLDEARLWATVAAFAGGPTISDDLPARLPAERLEVLKRMLPVAPLEARRYDMAPDASGTSPSWLFGRIDDDWWMLAGLNWGETARRFAFSLASHGAAGPLTAYDVWGDQRLADAEGQVTLGVAPRSALVLSLRRRRRAPAVAGTTRHVVQGFDLEDEHWDDRSRTLSGRSVMLDDRPYGITIALPAGLTPLRAASDPDAGAAVTVAGSAGRRAARLVLAAPPGNTVSWEVKFDQGRSNLSRPRGS
jgi:hypothetical protein